MKNGVYHLRQPTPDEQNRTQGDRNLQMASDAATAKMTVCVRNASKSYGLGKRRSNVLNSLDMTVKKGTIYGLLGASGCGKTTLLSCIVGRRSFDSGEVYVFGSEPGTKESGIPGPRVGYMPQELALYGEFTIKQTLHFFGRFYNLSKSFIKSQIEFLSKLLDLPPSHRIVKTLSGGQQRRVSFAVAVFHDPDLLILDEPTVGVDPLLRQSIWNHLVNLSSVHGRTIIITTHYIEEARQAHTIGLMRSGRLLAEDSPQHLLANHNLTSLEDVFLKLCMKENADQNYLQIANNSSAASVSEQTITPPAVIQQQDGHRLTITVQSSSDTDDQQQPTNETFADNENDVITCIPSATNNCDAAYENPLCDANEVIINEKKDSFSYKKKSSSSSTDDGNSSIGDTGSTGSSYSSNMAGSSVIMAPAKPRSRTFNLSLPSPHRTAALLYKNYLITFRNLVMFTFVFLLPVFQAFLFCIAIGHDPTSLKLAVVNEELNPSQGRVCNYTTGCTYSMYSCRYLRFINNETITQVHYSNHLEAMEAAGRGEVWGVIHFRPNFTDEFVLRETDGNGVDLQTIIGSEIGVSLDWSNQQISLILQRRLIDAFEGFSKELRKFCSQEEAAASIPLTFLDSEGKKPSFMHFMAPGIILTVIFFGAVGLTSLLFIAERKQGLLDRCLVAGVQMPEILLAHAINQFTILVGQTIAVFALMTFIFDVTCNGSLPLAFSLGMAQGLCGMCYGLMISSLCDNEMSAMHLALGSLMPNLLFSGIMWPMEGMPIALKYIAYSMPMTYAVESLRNILSHGWGFEKMDVYVGFIATIAWTIGLIAVSLIVVRVRKYTG